MTSSKFYTGPEEELKFTHHTAAMSATSVSSKASGTHPPPTSSKPKYLNVINAVPEESQADLFDFPPLPGTRRQLSATTHNPSESPPARRAKAVGKLRKVSSRSKKLEATNESLLPGSLPRLVDVPGPSCKPVAINGGTRSTPKRVRVSDGESTEWVSYLYLLQ